jgi:FHS family Na+ dependent glucose MFS transporter 1
MDHDQRTKAVKTIAYYFIYIALGLAFASLGPTLPGLARNTNSTLREISWLFFTHAAGYTISSLLVGRLYDRAPGHPIMAVSLLLIAVTMAVIPLVPWLWILAALLFLRGLASASIDVGGNTLLVWTHKDRSGPWINGLHFCFGLGGLIAPVIVAQSLVLRNDITPAYWVMAACALPVTLWLPWIKSPRIGAVTEEASMRSSRVTMVVLVTLFFFLHVGSEIAYSGWISTYAIEKNMLNEAQAAYLTSLFWGAITAGRLATVPFSSRVTPGKILMGNLIGCLISAGLLLLFPNSRGILLFSTFLMGFSMSSMFPVSILYADRSMKINAKVVGIFLVGANTGGMVIPWIIGQRFEAAGPGVLGQAMLVSIVAAFVVLILMIVKMAGFQRSHGEK